MVKKPTSTRPNRPLLVLAMRRPRGLTGELAAAFSEVAEERNWRVLDLETTEGSLAGEPTPIAAVTQLLPDDPMCDKLRGLGCPVVRMGHLPHPADTMIPASLPDVALGARMGCDYFVERGFRNLALLSHAHADVTPLISQAMREQASARGCDYQEHLLEQMPFITDRYDRRTDEVTRWLDGMPKPIGLLAANPGAASMVTGMCRRAGLSVPEQVAVLAFGDSAALCEFGPVSISAMYCTAQQVVNAALRLIDAQRAGEAVPPQTYFPLNGIITRRSTDIVAVDEPTVARAIRFMWDHLDVDLSVHDVARAVKTPEHTLARLFRKHFDRPIHAELRRVRLERFAQLLIETDQTVAQLAPQVGFKNGTYLTQAFRKTYGVTPRQHRLRARRATPKTVRDDPV